MSRKCNLLPQVGAAFLYKTTQPMVLAWVWVGCIYNITILGNMSVLSMVLPHTFQLSLFSLNSPGFFYS
ncbi:hypothetical protein XELAEV_18008491mg [Xenopus laevis]|uniref:Uncharacterized protein n=1 Tax=Xenopus laevis TaxID=8355 RepID=A0A974I644_XENLA|nr:hypothetical protein XELAEV_18008491mg [Xenopus laevis]